MLIVAALGLRYTPWPYATESALLALGLLLLPVFFEIHRAVTASAELSVFRSFQEASPHLDRAMMNYLEHASPRSIKCLGIVLYYQWSFLESQLARLLEESRTQLSIEIALLDPSWKEMCHLNDAWPAQAQGSYTRLQSFMQQHATQFADLKWTMKVYLYRSLPPWYGILLGDEQLFLGTSYWDHDKLIAGQNIVESFIASDKPRGAMRIREFIGWFNYSKKQVISTS